MPLLYDTVVLALTLYKTLRVGKRVSGDVSGGYSIAALLVRDGLMYYRLVTVRFPLDNKRLNYISCVV